MVLAIAVAALAVLALITQAGVLALQRVYPAQGEAIEVAGGVLQQEWRRARLAGLVADF